MNTIDHISYDRTVRDLRKVRVHEDLGLVNAHEALFLLGLYDGGSMPMSEAANVVGISRAAMTSMTDRLANVKLLERTPSPDDRRMTHISLTTTGLKLVALALVADLVPVEEEEEVAA